MGKQVCILSRSLGNYSQVLHPQGRIRQGSLPEFLLGSIGFVGGSGAAQQVGLAVSFNAFKDEFLLFQLVWKSEILEGELHAKILYGV